jgi:hypothetical protein
MAMIADLLQAREATKAMVAAGNRWCTWRRRTGQEHRFVWITWSLKLLVSFATQNWDKTLVPAITGNQKKLSS